jgi:hypothetical protein
MPNEFGLGCFLRSIHRMPLPVVGGNHNDIFTQRMQFCARRGQSRRRWRRLFRRGGFGCRCVGRGRSRRFGDYRCGFFVMDAGGFPSARPTVVEFTLNSCIKPVRPSVRITSLAISKSGLSDCDMIQWAGVKYKSLPGNRPGVMNWERWRPRRLVVWPRINPPFAGGTPALPGLKRRPDQAFRVSPKSRWYSSMT